MLVAIQGCCHGSLNQIYASIAQYESRHARKVDLLLLCGDFQALRNVHDFASLAVPQKYQHLGTFHEYYSGSRVAPVLTLVIGGNHEASNYMWELYHGGWLAPNIYYLGAAGCVRVDGLRVVGASGIYKSGDFRKGYYETVPYTSSTMRSIYHIRQYDIAKLLQLSVQDHTIVLSHDWPLTIPHHGDLPALLRRKPFFKAEIADNELGAPPLLQLLKQLQPDHWFAAHLHVKFAALFEHAPKGISGESATLTSGVTSGTVPPLPTSVPVEPANPDEIMIHDDDDGEVEPTRDAKVNGGAVSSGSGGQTSELAAVAAENPDEIMIDDEDDEEEGNAIVLPNANRDGSASANAQSGPSTLSKSVQGGVSKTNPDEVDIDSDGDETLDALQPASAQSGTAVTPHLPPEEAQAALAVDESVDLVEAVRKADPTAAQAVVGIDKPVSVGSEPVAPAPASTIMQQAIPAADVGPSKPGGSRVTKFLALDKCGPGKDFIQFLDIPAPASTAIPLPGATTSDTHPSPRITFDPEWLAITRVFHPYLSLEMRQKPLPDPEYLAGQVRAEMERIEAEGLLVPVSRPTIDVPTLDSGADADEGNGGGGGGGDAGSGLEVVRGEVEVGRVQRFWPTAPVHESRRGSPSAWYTNPQTVALCGMLGIPNKINPAPQQQPSL